METKNNELLAEVFNTNQPKLRVKMHMRNLNKSCPKKYRGFQFILHRLVWILPVEISSVITLYDLDQLYQELSVE